MIRGIDSQIMINKSIDYAKQLTDQNSNAQQAKDFIAAMEKAQIEHDDKTVNQTEETEGERIRREKEGQDGPNSRTKRDRHRETRHGKAAEEELEAEIEAKEGLGNSIDINI